MANQEIIKLDQTARMLAEAVCLPDIVAIRDKAEAARAYAKSVKAGLEMQNLAAELKLRAERKAGAFLSSLKLHGGDRRSKSHRATLKLEDLGINKYDSQRWQSAATVPDDRFEQYLESAKKVGREITSRGLLLIAKKFRTPRPRTRPIAELAHGSNASIPQLETRDEFGESLGELLDHRRLLASILTPICEDASVTLKSAERRAVVRLLREMDHLLHQLANGHGTALRIASAPLP